MAPFCKGPGPETVYRVARLIGPDAAGCPVSQGVASASGRMRPANGHLGQPVLVKDRVTAAIGVDVRGGSGARDRPRPRVLDHGSGALGHGLAGPVRSQTTQLVGVSPR